MQPPILLSMPPCTPDHQNFFEYLLSAGNYKTSFATSYRETFFESGADINENLFQVESINVLLKIFRVRHILQIDFYQGRENDHIPHQ